jgi:hypothetical protein
MTKEETKDYIIKVLTQYKGDDLERARSCFRNLTHEQLCKEYDASGRTCYEILESYQQHINKVDEAIAFIKILFKEK